MLRIPTTILGRDLVISVRLIVRPRFYLTGGGSLPSVLHGLESEAEGGVYEIQVYVERRSGCACGSLWHVAVARFGPIRFRAANDFGYQNIAIGIRPWGHYLCRPKPARVPAEGTDTCYRYHDRQTAVE